MSALRVGDIVRDRYGHDHVLILGHSRGYDGTESAWEGLYFPASADLGEPFTGAYPYDFAEQDANRPGALLPADPWSCWTEEDQGMRE